MSYKDCKFILVQSNCVVHPENLAFWDKSNAVGI